MKQPDKRCQWCGNRSYNEGRLSALEEVERQMYMLGIRCQCRDGLCVICALKQFIVKLKEKNGNK